MSAPPAPAPADSPPAPRRKTFFFTGLGVSSGAALGRAHVIESDGHEAEAHPIAPDEVDQEVARFRRAVDMAVAEVQEIGRTVAEKLDSQQAAIFDAHVTLLTDPLLIDKTVKRIQQEHKNAEHLFWCTTQDIGEKLRAVGDPYFSERSHDLFDVARRVLKFMWQLKHPEVGKVPAGSIVVANDLGPSETAQFKRDKIAGFCTNAGGPTSHTAIMAKALSLPAVVGLDLVTHYVRTGDFIIVDGTEGKVILHPTAEQIAYYEGRAREYEEARRVFSDLRALPAVTRDGVEAQLHANIEFPAELGEVIAQGAAGIGLFRTEYFFIDRAQLPSEEEQEEAYRLVFDTMEGRPAVFRTLDVGGDKLPQSMPHPIESNPFLGLRALRLCLAQPELFRSQLRPLLRAADGRELRLLLPMVSNVDEIHQAKNYIAEVNDGLVRKGCRVPSRILVGAMIEIPSAALQADIFARHVDFFSIGTNDLVQYTLAVDRVNKLVGHLFHETHPAVLGLIRHVVEAAERHRIELTVCGEMAGNPMLALLLMGLGVRSLSMSPSLIGPVKQAIRGIDLAYLERTATRLLGMESPAEAREALHKALANYVEPAGPTAL